MVLVRIGSVGRLFVAILLLFVVWSSGHSSLGDDAGYLLGCLGDGVGVGDVGGVVFFCVDVVGVWVVVDVYGGFGYWVGDLDGVWFVGCGVGG